MDPKHYLLTLLFALLLIGCTESAENTPSTPRLNPTEMYGEVLFSETCVVCHSVESGKIVRGPSMGGIATKAESRVAGQDARTYLQNSILHPSDFVVEGFDNIMPPTLGESLSADQLNALLDYLMTLR